MVQTVDVAVVGAGFAGLHLVQDLRRRGSSVVAFDAADEVGGVWCTNRYPGARCDIESLEYSFSFDAGLAEDWHWSERYAAQAEILAYARHVADRFDLWPHLRLGVRVLGVELDESAGSWHVRTDGAGDWTAGSVVLATGALSRPAIPDVPGLGEFAGACVHTARWPAGGIDVAGKRVGIVGTGSSGIQALPVLAAEAAQVTVFQRTPAYAVPGRNRPTDPVEEAAVKADYPAWRAANLRMPTAFGAGFAPTGRAVTSLTPDERDRELERCWELGGFALLVAFTDTMIDPEANEIVAAFVRGKIRATVHDSRTAELLCPQQPFGCKRVCLEDGYFEAFNLEHVSLVDVSEHPIERVTTTGVVVDGTPHPLDVLVLATGFDAITGSFLGLDVVGRGGRTLAEAWSAGPVTALGLGVPGFPNLFLVTGPGSPSVLTNMMMAIEQHVGWIGDALDHLRATGGRRIEARPEAAAAWVEHVNAIADLTLFPRCGSWYLGANVPGKPRVFMPLIGWPPYVERCSAVAAAGYEGFEIS